MRKPLVKVTKYRAPKIGKISKRAHPFVSLAWEEIIRQGVTVSSVSESSGVTRENIYNWKTRVNGPFLKQIEAVLDSLGYEIKIVKKKEQRNESQS